MNKELFSFFLTLISGFSTLLGFFVVYIKKDERKIIASCLYLASGVMISVSVLDLIPNSYKYISSYYFCIFSIFLILFYLIIGIIISNVLSKFIVTKDNDIYKLGILTMLTIMIHNIPEGIITYLTASNDVKLGINLALAITLHNIPEGISIAVPIYYATKNKKKSFIYILISAISEPLGAVISFLFFKNIPIIILGFLFSIIAGIMINISFTELLPKAVKTNFSNFYYFIIGIIIMILSLI